MAGETLDITVQIVAQTLLGKCINKLATLVALALSEAREVVVGEGVGIGSIPAVDPLPLGDITSVAC